MKELAGKLMRIATMLCLCVGVSVEAATLVRYDFEGSDLTPAESHNRITPVDFSYTGDDMTDAFPAGAGGSTACYSMADWPPNGDLDTYYTFSVTVEEGFKVDLATLRFTHSRSATGPTMWVARYSYDNITFRALRSGTLPADDTWYNAQTHVTNLTGTVHFRLYALQSTHGAGAWRVDNVELTGNIAMDDGRRIIRHQSFEGDSVDKWGVTTNAGPGSAVSVSSVRHHVGEYSQRLTGSDSADEDPYIDLANVSLSGIEEPRLWISYAADNPDSDDDLYVLLSYDNGSTWSWTNKLVDGYGNQDVAFGETSATNPATPSMNPLHYLIPGGNTQVKVRVLFDEKPGADNTADHYYVDHIRLIGKPASATSEAPKVTVYGSAFSIQSDQAKVAVHVITGDPDPEVNVYWGVTDGGEDSGAWGFASSLGTRNIGYASARIGELEPGRTYYYRFHAGNSAGSHWTDTAGSFTAKTVPIGAARRMYLDSFAVSTNMPLNIDGDGDGVSDAWEIAYLGGRGETAGGNKDGDAMTNEEEFWAGTDPDDANSVLRILSVDISDAASDNVTIRWSGGGHQGTTDFMGAGDSGVRRFRVLAANNDAENAKSAVASRTPTGTGVNTWVDTNAIGSVSARFYEISVVHGDGAYTNTEEWAVVPQERPQSSERFICVPVHYRVAASNNLNSVLGEHLARGMHAGDTVGNSDSIRILNGSGIWDVYYLSSAHGWTDSGFAGPVDVEISPGQPMWAVRGNGAVTRSNAVYAGLTFNNGMMSNQTFTDGEWTAFGWPLPSARTHASDGGTDQLGFSSQGTGGLSYDRSSTNSGDQIWVPHGDGWRFYMLLDNHGDGGDAYDGRWWGNGTGGGGLTDFSLEPGKAYYYFHTTNWSSGDFTWKPQTP